jgi:bifunctional NMN adenylyltransferase/nudix hydrolase
MSKRHLTVYMGRFSPFHNGHAEVLLRALKLSQTVLVVMGSDKQPRRVKNPWSAQERAVIISEWYAAAKAADPTLGHLVVDSIRDWPYNDDMWQLEAQKLIASYNRTGEPPYITGADRDRTTFYLKKFPAPNYILDLTEEDQRVSMFLSATTVRDVYFGKRFNGQQIDEKQVDVLLKSFLPPTTLRYMLSFMTTEEYRNLVEEYKTIVKRKAGKVRSDGYPVIEQTVDAVVIQSGHILLVRRAAYPGKGLWALPGGHVNPDEWLLDSCVRELKEESKLKVPEPVIYGSLKFDMRFEKPDRSELGRVITQAFCFKLPDHVGKDGQVVLPEVYGTVDDIGDGELNDTDKARWVPINEALDMSPQLFDDHHAIIETMVNHLNTEKADKRKD